MSATSMKPVNVMAHLHLGCGESLSQLLPAQPEAPKAPARERLQSMPRQPRNKPRDAGGRR